jgi:cysteine desulfurase
LKQTGRSYLDFNATAPMRPAAREACVAAFDRIGNPSSIHREGREARAIIEEARVAVAELAGVSPRSVTFTGSGTEAANLALTPAIVGLRKAPLARLIVSAGEHSCIINGHRFAASAVERAAARRRPDRSRMAGANDRPW